MEGDVGDKVGCTVTGMAKDHLGVVGDEGNGRGVGRGGSLIDEGSLGEDEGYGSWFMGDIWYGKVVASEKGQRKGLLGRRVLRLWRRGWAEVGRREGSSVRGS